MLESVKAIMITLLGASACSPPKKKEEKKRKAFWETIENADAPVLYYIILQLTSVRLYSSRGACLLTGACAKKRDKTVGDSLESSLCKSTVVYMRWVVSIDLSASDLNNRVARLLHDRSNCDSPAWSNPLCGTCIIQSLVWHLHNPIPCVAPV